MRTIRVSNYDGDKILPITKETGNPAEESKKILEHCISEALVKKNAYVVISFALLEDEINKFYEECYILNKDGESTNVLDIPKYKPCNIATLCSTNMAQVIAFISNNIKAFMCDPMFNNMNEMVVCLMDVPDISNDRLCTIENLVLSHTQDKGVVKSW